MTGSTFVLVLQAALLAPGADRFADAYKIAKTEKRPMMVLVGAKWCPGCQTMKNETIPQLQRTGKLDRVAYAHVDIDKQPELAQRMMQGRVVPQLILFVPDSTGWRRYQVTGAVPPRQVESLISSATGWPETAQRTGLLTLDSR
jgi:thioredoxin-like negative regulator of GroEL